MKNMWLNAKKFLDDKSPVIGMSVLGAMLVWGFLPKEERHNRSEERSSEAHIPEWVSDEVKALNEDFNFFYFEYSGLAGKKHINCLLKKRMHEQESTSYIYDAIMVRYGNLCLAFGEIEGQTRINSVRLVSGEVPRSEDLHNFVHIEDEEEYVIGPFFSLEECRYYQDFLARLGEKVMACRPYDNWMQNLFLPSA